jgi:P27 family predicted phage terminase small subunit
MPAACADGWRPDHRHQGCKGKKTINLLRRAAAGTEENFVMPGRRPTPTYLRLLKGNPQHRPIGKAEPEPTVPPSVPPAPEHLYGYALDEWCRVTPELFHMRVLTNADLKVLEAYCTAYGRWREAEEALARYRAQDPNMHGLVLRTPAGIPTPNPLVNVARKAGLDMLRYAIEFGLTPAARSRIAAGLDPAASKFGDLLA